jgi:hypothetical protein
VEVVMENIFKSSKSEKRGLKQLENKYENEYIISYDEETNIKTYYE